MNSPDNPKPFRLTPEQQAVLDSTVERTGSDSMFDKLRRVAVRSGRAFARKAQAVLRLRETLAKLDLLPDHPMHPLSENPDLVKSLLPPSCFTKKGPGVTAQKNAAVARMTVAQRRVARRHGWI